MRPEHSKKTGQIYAYIMASPDTARTAEERNSLEAQAKNARIHVVTPLCSTMERSVAQR